MIARNYASIGKKWLHGKVISVAQRSLKVKLISGLVIHRHFDQIHKRTVDKIPEDRELVTDSDAYTYFSVNNDESETISSQPGSPDAPTTEQLSRTIDIL